MASTYAIVALLSVALYYLCGNQLCYHTGEQSGIHMAMELMLRVGPGIVMNNDLATSTDPSSWQSATVKTTLKVFRPTVELPCSEMVFPKGFCGPFDLPQSELFVELPSRDPGRTISAICTVPASDTPLPLIIHYHSGGLCLGR